jgi:hypothetical protein
MPSPVKRAAAAASTEDRREKLIRELKLALVDQHVHREGSGCNPYESVQGRGRSERWEPRRR